ncbi:MAG: hypothetical protein GYA21_01970 [Myxococcales bacterium]|nr:hypothetical protein [Myxococcales bacterium]
MKRSTILGGAAGSCLAILLAAGGAGCPKRYSGDIDVDEVQGCVGRIESHLRAMRAELKKKDLERAAKEYAEGRETFDDNRALLSAYPELGELSASLEEAASLLCYESVSILLERFFETVRAREPREAERRLEEAQAQFGRCQPMLEKRDDFTALKVNLDTAPQALSELRHLLERPARLERIQAVRQEIEPHRSGLAKQLQTLEAKPRDVAARADAEKGLAALKEALAVQGDFRDEPEWKALSEEVAREQAAAAERLAKTARRGRVLELTEEALPMAVRQASLATTQRDPAQASRLIAPVVETYRRCQETLEQALREEPALAKYVVPLQGQKHAVDWLARHCASEAKRAEKLLQRLTGKKAPPPAPKVEAEEPPTKPKPEKPAPKGKKRRVRRW